jgi:hypothetical protein
MDCEKLREVLIEHVDGLLGREEAEFARAHLAACSPCRMLQEEVRRNFAALDAWEDEDLPAGAFDRLRARLPSGPAVAVGAVPAPAARRSWARLLVPYVAGLATAAAAMFAVVRFGVDAPAPAGDPPATLRGPAGTPPLAGSIGAPAPAAAADLVSFGGGAADARAVEVAPSPRPGEKTLIFRDASNGVLRKFFLPDGVDPGRVLLMEQEREVIVPAGVR